ncbi:MAG TPA: helix-turn-helix domain-containing protein, partial [Burkholderiaceae bacterium]|nr:helix-turn-helix domain-containing protein [Burkholderiaceae bacterium]
NHLTRTELLLSDISGTLGFCAPSHFTRFFQQHLGTNPGRYRQVVNIYGGGRD